MNSISFNSISELNNYKKTLNLSSEANFIQYLNLIHSNLLQRETNILEESLYTKQLSNILNKSSLVRKSLLQKKGCLRLESDNGIKLKTFLEYMNLQEFIGERLFKYFNKSKTNSLSKSEFTNGIKNLYYNDISELIKLTFFLSDFNEDGKIYKYDMKLLLVYIPSSSDVIQNMKIKQINKIINSFFDENIDNYLANEFNNNAPFFYFIYLASYLFLNCPFLIKNINYFSPKNKTIKFILKKSNEKLPNSRNLLQTTIKRGNTFERVKESNGLMTNFNEKNKYKLQVLSKIEKKNLFQYKRSSSQTIIIPDRNTMKYNRKFSYGKDNFMDKNFIIAKEKENIKYNKIKNEINSFKKNFKTQQKYVSTSQRNYFQEFSRNPQHNSILYKNGTKEENIINNYINSNIDKKGLFYKLKDKLPVIQNGKLKKLSVGYQFKKQNKDINELDFSDSEDNQKNLENILNKGNNDLISAYCYKEIEENNNILKPIIINKFYVVLSGKELLFFKSENKTDFSDLWYIYKSHITIGKELINNTDYFSVNINFFNSNAVNKLYFLIEKECKIFAKKLKKAIHDLNFSDYYELEETLGQGHFAKVCKCKNKFSNKLYAVKIINKTDLKQKDLELIHQERNYLDLIKHPNIIGLKDYFEDKKTIYLITEYCSGGDLFTFLEKNQKIQEKTAAKIIYKLAEGIQYLNIFGIVHRDLKPENILFSEENDIKSIKIIDLGVCQTLTYGQMANEPIGTEGYISPEIYMHKEYSFKTDIWSLGIILYLLITQGLLPFDNENMDKKVIGKKVVYLQQEYPHEYFGKCNKSLIDLLDKMLEKNMEKRIDINGLLKDIWFNIVKK